MKYAIIENGTVSNIALADAPINANWIEVTGLVDIGYTWDGAAFTAPPVVEPPVIVPESVSMRQARLALLSMNLLDSVNAAVAAAGGAAQIEWEYASEVQRNSPLVAQMGQALSLTDEDLDGLFTAAAKL